MSAKKKDKLPAIVSNDQLLTTIDDIARLEVSIRALEAKRDAAVQLVRTEHDKRIEEDKVRLKSLMKLAANYSGANRPSLFKMAKSAFSALARFGFRSGNPTVKALNKKCTEEFILGKLKALGKYIRTVEVIDKELIHADYKAEKLTDAQLADMGLRIDSGETFFVESKADDSDRLTSKSEEEETTV